MKFEKHIRDGLIYEPYVLIEETNDFYPANRGVSGPYYWRVTVTGMAGKEIDQYLIANNYSFFAEIQRYPDKEYKYLFVPVKEVIEFDCQPGDIMEYVPEQGEGK